METLNKYIRYIFFGKANVSYPPVRRKSDLNEVLPENWSFMDDPLKKNLADYLVDNNITKSKENQNFWLRNSSPPLTSFLDEYRMENANRSVYNDEFKFCSTNWHPAKTELTQNNSVGNCTGDREVVKSSEPINIDMNPKINDCYQAASQCSSKLEELKLRLSNKTRAKRDNKTYIRKPKKQFVEASSVEDGFEDAFESDDVDRLGNVDYVEFNNFGSVLVESLHQIDAALTKIEDNSKQHKQTRTLKMTKNDTNDTDALDTSSTMSRDNEDIPKEKRKRTRKKKCKFFRIPSQNSDSEAASSFEQSPITYMSHIGLSSSCDHTPSSLELPISFRQNLSSESLENRRLSTTESEDSFIQFCHNGEDSCSESSVFDSSDEEYDYDSDSEVESGDITSALSKSINNLTDDVLYTEKIRIPFPEEDQVDCAKPEQVLDESEEAKSSGILVNSAKKLANKDKPHKTVRFSSAPPTVKVMRVWAYAARCARAGHWERYVADRDRFKKRIADVEMAISWVLKPQHRTRILFQRVRPWLNAQKRREEAEKKAKEEADALKREQEALAAVHRNEDEVLVSLDTNRDEGKTNLHGDRSQSQNSEDNERNLEKKSNEEVSNETRQYVENNPQTIIRTKENKTVITNTLRNGVDEKDHEHDSLKNVKNSDCVKERAVESGSEASEIEGLQITSLANRTEDKFVTKKEERVGIVPNKSDKSAKSTTTNKDPKQLSNDKSTKRKETNNIKTRNIKSHGKKNSRDNSKEQNRSFTSNKIAEIKEIKASV